MFRTHPLEVPARLSALRARVWMRVRRPEEIGEGTRWLFVVLVLASLLLTLPAPLTAANGTLRLVAVAGAVVLGLSWGAGYLRRSAPLAMDLVDAVALLAFALASPEPTIVFPLVFAALWFRSLYGSGRRAVLRCGLYAGALGASLPLWPYVPGHVRPQRGYGDRPAGRYFSGHVPDRHRGAAPRRDSAGEGAGGAPGRGARVGGLTAVGCHRRGGDPSDRLGGVCPGLRGHAGVASVEGGHRRCGATRGWGDRRVRRRPGDAARNRPVGTWRRRRNGPPDGP